MGFHHGHALAVDLGHGFNEHRALASPFFADQQMIAALLVAPHDLVDALLLLARDPSVIVLPRRMDISQGSAALILQGNFFAGRRKLEDGVARLKSVLHLLQHHVLVV